MNPETSWSAPSGGERGELVVPVSALNRAIGTLLERNFALAWISGEVSNFTCAASGHWYFSIKDSQAQIRCVMFRMRAKHAEFTPREGDRIEVRALVTMYEPRGELQLNVEAVRRTGQGRLYEAFLRLKAQLEGEGLFDSARKRPLPAHPRAIGIVTSLQAAALRDVLSTLARRAPHVPLVIYPAPVQGAGAGARLAAMLESAGQRAEVDVVVLCRGGGSIEDLWAFNEEVLARAIAASSLPVISGVGHETDFTIADFAADVRAPTPTAAAEMVSPQRTVLLRDLEQRRAQLARALGRMQERRAQQLDWLARRLVSPVERLERQRKHLQQLALRLSSAGGMPAREARARLALAALRWSQGRPDVGRVKSVLAQHAAHLRSAMARRQEQQRARLSELAARTALLSPQRTLERGYAALLDPRSGQALRDPAALQPGRRFTVHLAQGAADIGVTDVQVRLDESL